jgi:hypothetical protein
MGIIADPLGWRWVVDGHKGDGRRYIVHSDELLSAFLELEASRGRDWQAEGRRTLL